MNVKQLNSKRIKKAMKGINPKLKRYAEDMTFIADINGRRIADVAGTRIKTKK